VIAFDTNVLVYALRRDMPFHDRAAAIVKERATGREPWAIPWPCVHELLGIVTNPRIFREPSPIDLVCRQIAFWLGSPAVVLLAEDPGYWSVFEGLVRDSGVVGARVHDARIAALCLRHGVRELWTADRDFGRFAALKTRNPLLAAG